MARRFFVGGNFKMNPCSVEEKHALVKIMNYADLDQSTGESFDGTIRMEMNGFTSRGCGRASCAVSYPIKGGD
jgi:hypothetical protein